MNNNNKKNKSPDKENKEYLIEFRNEEIISRLINPFFEVQPQPAVKKNKHPKKKITNNKTVSKKVKLINQIQK